MVRVVIYGEKPTDIEGLEKMLREILTENRRWPMIHTYISDLDAYLHFVKGNPYLIMLASVQGRQGAEIVEKNPGKQPGGVLDLIGGGDPVRHHGQVLSHIGRGIVLGVVLSSFERGPYAGRVESKSILTLHGQGNSIFA